MLAFGGGLCSLSTSSYYYYYSELFEIVRTSSLLSLDRLCHILRLIHITSAEIYPASKLECRIHDIVGLLYVHDVIIVL